MSKNTDSILKELFNNHPDNTWVFTGGTTVQGGFSQVGGARNYVGHFEEYIRWKQTSEIEETRQRYTINTAKKGQTLKDIVENWENRVGNFHPKAVVYMAGIEDYSLVTAGIEDFKQQLKRFIEKALGRRENHGFAVLQKPYATADAACNANIEAYCTAIDAVVSSFEKEESCKRIVVTDHYTQTKNQADFLKTKLNIDGTLNPWGHFEIGKQLCAQTIQTTEGYPADLAGLNQSQIRPTEADETITEILDLRKMNSDGLKMNHHQKKIQRKMEENSSLTWLFMGDSITHAAAWTNGYDGITQLFEKFLKEDLKRIDDVVINTAVSGATTITTLEHIEQRLERYNPDIISIMLGTNDCAAENQTPDNYERDLKQIIKKAKEKGALVILRTPTPGMRDELLTPYLEKLKKLAAEDKNLLYIDHHTHMKAMYRKYPHLFPKFYLDSETLGLHPGANGHLIMAREFIEGCGIWKENSTLEKIFYKI